MRDLDDRRPDAMDHAQAAVPAHRQGVHRRHYRRARCGQIDPRRCAGRSTAAGRRVAWCASIRRHRSRLARSLGIASAWTTSPMTTCSSALWRRGAPRRPARCVRCRPGARCGGIRAPAVRAVGVGQVEVEIVPAAHTTVVVTVPGLGDAIQANKSGLFEVADLFVVNKGDTGDADAAGGTSAHARSAHR